MTYHQENDYLIPDIKMNEQPKETIGKFGRMRRQFLIENRSSNYQYLLLTNKLTTHLIEIEKAAQERFEMIESQMKDKQGVTEKLKESNQINWIKVMNSIKTSAEEIVLNEIVFN